MMKKNIHLAIDPGLLEAIDALSRQEGTSRAEVIREACRMYIDRVERERKDREYQEAYRRNPESTEVGDIQLALLKDILPDEEW